jgi:hypothetical protein
MYWQGKEKRLRNEGGRKPNKFLKRGGKGEKE